MDSKIIHDKSTLIGEGLASVIHTTDMLVYIYLPNRQVDINN